MLVNAEEVLSCSSIALADEPTVPRPADSDFNERARTVQVKPNETSTAASHSASRLQSALLTVRPPAAVALLSVPWLAEGYAWCAWLGVAMFMSIATGEGVASRFWAMWLACSCVLGSGFSLVARIEGLYVVFRNHTWLCRRCAAIHLGRTADGARLLARRQVHAGRSLLLDRRSRRHDFARIHDAGRFPMEAWFNPVVISVVDSRRRSVWSKFLDARHDRDRSSSSDGSDWRLVVVYRSQ